MIILIIIPYICTSYTFDNVAGLIDIFPIAFLFAFMCKNVICINNVS